MILTSTSMLQNTRCILPEIKMRVTFHDEEDIVVLVGNKFIRRHSEALAVHKEMIGPSDCHAEFAEK